jgi:hypothetical protein
VTFGVRCSAFGVQGSGFKVRRSGFKVRFMVADRSSPPSHPIDDDRLRGGGDVPNLHGLPQKCLRHLETAAATVANLQDRVPRSHLDARRSKHRDPDAMVDDVLEPFAAGAERDGGAAYVFGFEPGHESAPRRRHDLDVWR